MNPETEKKAVLHKLNNVLSDVRDVSEIEHLTEKSTIDSSDAMPQQGTESLQKAAIPDQTAAYAAGSLSHIGDMEAADQKISEAQEHELHRGHWQDELLYLFPGLHELTDRGNFMTGHHPTELPELHDIRAELSNASEKLEQISTILDKFDQEYRT